MRRLRIAIVAHIRHPIARPFMGGMEAFAWELANALVARGHDVHLLASGDSASDLPPGVTLHPIIPEHYDRAYPWHDFHGTDTLNAVLDDAFARAVHCLSTEQFDIVHNNSLHRFIPRLAAAGRLPMVTSLHIPPFAVLANAIADSQCPWHRQTVTSDKQRQVWWPDALPPTASVVHNGIDLARWPFHDSGDGTAVWSARITPTKGTHLAIAAAKQNGCALKICGTIEHADYFKSKVAPHLNDQIRYLGHLSTSDLAGVYAQSSVFLFTPQWEEPFGLAAVEAMATGLPVAATPFGSVREVLQDAGSVAASNTAAGLSDAIDRALDIPPATVRANVARRFALSAMIGKFEGLYHDARLGLSRKAHVPEYQRHELRSSIPQALTLAPLGSAPLPTQHYT